MLDFEAALARACARNDLIPEEAAEPIASACSADRFDAAEIGRTAADSAQPVVPLVAALRDAVGPDASGHVHHGATSQDVLDSAAMLVAKRALGPILEDAAAAAAGCAQLAERYGDTPIMGRLSVSSLRGSTSVRMILSGSSGGE